MITRENIKDLAAYKGICVSLYAPMFQAGKETRQNHIRFKTQIQKAKQGLEAAGFSTDDIFKIVDPAESLVNNNEFWQHQQAGLGVFLNSEGMQLFKLPIEVPELAITGTVFHLKPLMTVLKNDGRYFVLALSLNKVRLFEATKYSIYELNMDDLDNVPNSLKEALKFDVYQKYLGHHSNGPAGNTVFHGHGAGEDDRKAQILYYFKQLENGVSDLLAVEQAPLVFAGVDYLFPLYQKANHYPHLLDKAITGNPDDWSKKELHERSWRLVETFFTKTQEEAFQKFKALEDSNHVSKNVNESLLAAFDGRIDTLLVAVGSQVWGRFDSETRQITKGEANNSEDLLNLAASYTLMAGGKVITLAPEAMPDNVKLAAIYRY